MENLVAFFAPENTKNLQELIEGGLLHGADSNRFNVASERRMARLGPTKRAAYEPLRTTPYLGCKWPLSRCN